MIDKETYRRIYSTGYQAGRQEAQKTAEAVMEAFAHRMKQTGAEEMRERAAQRLEREGRMFLAHCIRALPVTPEEPT